MTAMRNDPATPITMPSTIPPSTIPPSTKPTSTPNSTPGHRGGPRSAGLRPCRITVAPSREPHFDDESPTRHLRLVERHAVRLPFAPVIPAPRPVPSDPFAVRPTSRSELPEPRDFGRHFMQALIEVLSGRRPVAQLAGLTTAGVHVGLTRDQGRGKRLDAGDRAPIVHSIHIMEPADGVAELSAVIQVGRRYRAVAGRIEGMDGRWRCTRLQIG